MDGCVHRQVVRALKAVCRFRRALLGLEDVLTGQFQLGWLAFGDGDVVLAET